jgi:hypothetical protein
MAALDGAVPEDGAVEASTGREDALAMDTGPQVDAMATADSGTSDATDPADAGQEYPSGVRG